MEINILGFMPALLPVVLSPGASFTLVMSGALSGGRNGLFITLTGTAIGIYTHALLIGLGITAVIASSPILFNVLKIAGTAYLLWLGVTLILSGIKAKQTESLNDTATVTIKEAWLANILNPKAIIFYLTVVSQFAGRQGGISNYLALASIHVAVMSIWLVSISYTLIFSVKNINPLILKKYINIAGGALLLIFSIHGFMH